MFIVTTNVGTEREVARELEDGDLIDFIERATAHPRFLPDGGIIQIRRADYLDIHDDDEIDYRPKLTLIQGGKV